MTEEKKSVGRPRKYATRAERQKAYHERKKQRVKELEDEVRKLEKQDSFSFVISDEFIDSIPFKHMTEFSWKKITPSEIALMGTQDLEALVITLESEIDENFSLSNSLENIVVGIISKYHLRTLDEKPETEIDNITAILEDNYTHLESSIQQQTLLYLMKAELASRQRLEGKKTRLDLFEAKINELEKDGKIAEIKKKSK